MFLFPVSLSDRLPVIDLVRTGFLLVFSCISLSVSSTLTACRSSPSALTLASTEAK